MYITIDLSLDNGSLSWQQLQWGQLTKQIWLLHDWSQLERNELNNLTMGRVDIIIIFQNILFIIMWYDFL